MPVETEQTIQQFDGNDSTTVFPFNFPFLENDDIIVTLTDIASGVDELPEVLGTDYSLSGVNTDSGSVAMVVAPEIGQRLTIQRDVDATQKLDLKFKTKLDSNNITRALDKLTMLVQEMATLLFGGRVLRFPNTDPSNVNGLLPPQAQRLGLFLRFDDTLGNPQLAALGDPDNIGVLLNEADMASRSATNASSQLAIALFVEDKILDEDDFFSDDPLRAPSQQSTAVFITDQIAIHAAAFQIQIDDLGTEIDDLEIALAVSAKESSPTGKVDNFMGANPPTGWILANEKTIGRPASNATNRANIDTEDLFLLAWDSIAALVVEDNTGSPVGRGASAQADFDADRRIHVVDTRGRCIFGKDDMGGASANRITNVGDDPIDGDLLGDAGGSEIIKVDATDTGGHALTIGEMPIHNHNNGDNDKIFATSVAPSGQTPAVDSNGEGVEVNIINDLPMLAKGNDEDHDHPFAAVSEPGNNLTPGLILNKIIKL